MLIDASSGPRVEDFWGTGIVSYAIEVAASEGLAKMVEMLLMAEGEDRQKHWATVRATNIPALLRAAACGSAPTMGVLLAAGADEETRDHTGRCASEFAGMMLPVDTTTTNSKIAAVRRTLKRAPAYRARSWAWSTAEVSPECGGDAAAATAAGRVRRDSSRSPVGVRVFRPRHQLFFTTRFQR